MADAREHESIMAALNILNKAELDVYSAVVIRSLMARRPVQFIYRMSPEQHNGRALYVIQMFSYVQGLCIAVVDTEAEAGLLAAAGPHCAHNYGGCGYSSNDWLDHVVGQISTLGRHFGAKNRVSELGTLD